MGGGRSKVGRLSSRLSVLEHMLLPLRQRCGDDTIQDVQATRSTWHGGRRWGILGPRQGLNSAEELPEEEEVAWP